jgi:hypothetical protein
VQVPERSLEMPKKMCTYLNMGQAYLSINLHDRRSAAYGVGHTALAIYMRTEQGGGPGLGREALHGQPWLADLGLSGALGPRGNCQFGTGFGVVRRLEGMEMRVKKG